MPGEYVVTPATITVEPHDLVDREQVNVVIEVLDEISTGIGRESLNAMSRTLARLEGQYAWPWRDEVWKWDDVEPPPYRYLELPGPPPVDGVERGWV